MNRDTMIQKLQSHKGIWDILVIGGGATGLGIAVDAAARGYKTLLLEQHDFAKGTSSRSTKLVHGGVRYLQQGDISLVLEDLKERGLMIKNAPHLVSNQAFVIPNYSWWDGPFYQLGLKIYDFMSGDLGIGSSKRLSVEETICHIPTIDQKELAGGVIYFDGQFDDARMAISLAKTAAQFDGVLLNYMKVEKEQAARTITEKEQALKDAYDNWGALEEASKVKDQKIEKLNDHVFLQFWCLKFHQQVHD